MPTDPSTVQPKQPPGAAVEPIVASKLFPPRLARKVVARERLLQQLLDARRLRCIAIQGPAGYGKTTAMVAFRTALLPLGFDVAWLTLASEDDDVDRWLDYLLASLHQVDPGIVREARLLAGSGTEGEAVERIIFALVRSIADHPRDLVLVIEDLHSIAGTEIHECLQWLIDFAPSNLHIVLTSRSPMPISLARLRSQSLTLELDLRDLRFSSAESEEFLRTQVGEIDHRDAELLHEMTDGWVAGLQLLTVDWKKSESSRQTGSRLTGVRIKDARAFGTYFEREVLSRLSPVEINLLASASICDRFCASLCNALLDQPETAVETATILTHLEADNVFLTQVESSEREPWYRLHPLLSEALKLRLSLRGDETLRGAHRSAWLWFRSRGLLDEAVHHAVRAGDSAEAASLLEQCAQRLLIRGDLRKLIGLVREIPPEHIKSHVGLRLWMARSHLYAREFDRCAALIAELQADIPEADKASRFTLTLLTATLSVQRDNTDAAMQLLPDLLHPPEPADATAIGSRNNILTWLYMHRGEYERARQVQQDAPKLLIDGVPLLGSGAGILLGQCMVGLSYSLEGDIPRAERIYRDVLHEADRNSASCADPAAMATALLGEVLYELNNTTEALRLLESKIDVLERVSIPDSVLRVMIVLAASHWLAGRELDGLSYIDRLQEYSLNLGLDRLRAYGLGALVDRHLQRGEFDLAKEQLASLTAIDARHVHSHASALGEIELVTLRARIRWHLAVGDFDSAAQLMDQLIELCTRRGRGQLVAQLHLLKGVIDDRRGEAASARESVLTALRLGRRLGLVRSLLDADPSALDLIRRTSAATTLDPLTSFYVERLFAAQEATDRINPDTSGRPSVPAGNGEVSEPLSERETEIVHLLSQALPNKKIARTLNLSPETVKWHLKNIYGKLGVSGRDEAVARIRDIESDTRPDRGPDRHNRRL